MAFAISVLPVPVGPLTRHREHRLAAPRLGHAPIDAAGELTRHRVLADDAAAEKGGHLVGIDRGGRARRRHRAVDARYLRRRAIEHPRPAWRRGAAPHDPRSRQAT